MSSDWVGMSMQKHPGPVFAAEDASNSERHGGKVFPPILALHPSTSTSNARSEATYFTTLSKDSS